MVERLRFSEQFQDYNRWKDNLSVELGRYQRWLDEHKASSPEDKLRINDSLDLLRSDQLTIAFVAEFSRGKSELINAIFFAEHGRRLLPSAAGRTTMCPTELFYDRREERAYVRLLPIETRAEEVTIGELKGDPSRWETIELDVSSPEQMQRALQAVVEVKCVAVDEAQRLDFSAEDLPALGEGEQPLPEGVVEIPRWRHAIISFPHPLLKQGLTILDTPGLNALGSEPELTLNMLPKAQAVVFVLGADTGVTRSDLDIWQHHIKGFCGSCEQGLVVVLNKIDTLWDELQDEQSVQASIANQGKATSTTLGVDEACIFPVSAHKGLLGKIKGDSELLGRSRLLDLESFLSDHIMSVRRGIILENIRHDIEHMLDTSRAVLFTRLSEAKEQRASLQSLTGEKQGLMLEMMKRTREEQTSYLKNVESFQASRRVIGQQVRSMMDALSIDNLDRLIVDGRDEMLASWTTMGIKATMKSLFDRFYEVMREVQVQNEQTRRLVQAIYRKFQDEHGLTALTPKLFRIMKYSVELEKLNQEAEAFRNSPVATFTEQGSVTRKFFVSVVSRARDIFLRANQDASAWSREILNPLVKEIKEHKLRMEQRLETLKQVSQSKHGLDANIQELEQRCSTITVELESLQEIRDQIFTGFEQQGTAPTAVSELQRAAS